MEKNFAHWYRRAVHAFGSSFLIYYLIPDTGYIGILKKVVVIVSIILFTLIEIARIKKMINIFGLREYEKNRFGSYIYFGIGTVLLLIFFPQQIAIPSILCAAFVDPVIGELRDRVEVKKTYICGFILSFALFYIVWYNASFPFSIFIPVIGAFGAIVGEMRKFRWIDDDFSIQIVPAILIGFLYLIAMWVNVPFLPNQVIVPWEIK